MGIKTNADKALHRCQRAQFSRASNKGTKNEQAIQNVQNQTNVKHAERVFDSKIDYYVDFERKILELSLHLNITHLTNYGNFTINDKNSHTAAINLAYPNFKKDNNGDKIEPNSDGYLQYKGLQLHLLMAILWLPNPMNHPEVIHIDGNKLNNHIKNLKWNKKKLSKKELKKLQGI
tara:strand:- start:1267 stop:1794 length:528 start_codon:yes stop_codon:yes gene_type:complete